MTPEQRAQFEKTLADLQVPEDLLKAAAPDAESIPQQAEEEQLQEVSVDIPEMPAEPAKPAPIDDVMKAFEQRAGDRIEKPADGTLAAAQEREAGEQFEIKEVDVPIDHGAWDQLAQEVNAAADVPGLEEFMREMERQGKLDNDGFLKDEAKPVKLDPEAIEELHGEDNAAGQALVAYLTAEQEWKREVIRAFNTHAAITRQHTAELREITDGLERDT